MRVALLFIDGVGIGDREPEYNPLARGDFLMSRFVDGTAPVLDEGTRYSVDATFGVPGRPQSASNQAGLYTGLPIPRLLGRHVLGFPNGELRARIEANSVFRALTRAGRTVALANAYPEFFLSALGLSRLAAPAADLTPALTTPSRWLKKARPSAVMLAAQAAGVELRTFGDANRDAALTHDIDGRWARGERRFDDRRHAGFDVPLREAEDAARVFWGLGADLTVFEYYLADEAGHRQHAETAVETLKTFDAFARAVVSQRPHDSHVIVTSDHGNVEDLRTKGHTRNLVPVVVYGARRDSLSIRDVSGVGQSVLELFDVGAIDVS
jgi:hypothetical protein